MCTTIQIHGSNVLDIKFQSSTEAEEELDIYFS